MCEEMQPEDQGWECVWGPHRAWKPVGSFETASVEPSEGDLQPGLVCPLGRSDFPSWGHFCGPELPAYSDLKDVALASSNPHFLWLPQATADSASFKLLGHPGYEPYGNEYLHDPALWSLSLWKYFSTLLQEGEFLEHRTHFFYLFLYSIEARVELPNGNCCKCLLFNCCLSGFMGGVGTGSDPEVWGRHALFRGTSGLPGHRQGNRIIFTKSFFSSYDVLLVCSQLSWLLLFHPLCQPLFKDTCWKASFLSLKFSPLGRFQLTPEASGCHFHTNSSGSGLPAQPFSLTLTAIKTLPAPPPPPPWLLNQSLLECLRDTSNPVCLELNSCSYFLPCKLNKQEQDRWNPKAPPVLPCFMNGPRYWVAQVANLGALLASPPPTIPPNPKSSQSSCAKSSLTFSHSHTWKPSSLLGLLPRVPWIHSWPP